MHRRIARTVDVLAEGVLVLEDGTINFQGETTFQHIQVGVIGGTRAYQHVLGQLTILRTLPNGDDIDEVRFVHVDSLNDTLPATGGSSGAGPMPGTPPASWRSSRPGS